MRIDEARERYPALLAYIEGRSALGGRWYDQLRADETAALAGQLRDTAEQLAQAQADYGRYPYNSAMGEFLGLTLQANHEPPRGYYMASCVLSHHRLGEAQREAERLIAEGKELRIVAARSKADRKPTRFFTFKGPEQIKIEGGVAYINNGKRKGALTSNWSVETAIVRVVEALRTGRAYGEAA